MLAHLHLRHHSGVSLTWSPVASLHPDVAVVLGHARLRVQKGHADASLGTQTRIVVAAVLDGLPVELVPQPGEKNKRKTAENKL